MASEISRKQQERLSWAALVAAGPFGPSAVGTRLRPNAVKPREAQVTHPVASLRKPSYHLAAFIWEQLPASVKAQKRSKSINGDVFPPAARIFPAAVWTEKHVSLLIKVPFKAGATLQNERLKYLSSVLFCFDHGRGGSCVGLKASLK